MSSLTRRIADFSRRLKLADVPDDVLAKAKLHILDAIGCGIAGTSSDLVRRMLAYLDLEHRAGPCPVFGSGRRFGPAAAAFGNAATMNALDFDDGFEVGGKGMGHPGATIIAAAASASFVREVNGPAFLAAVIAAYEVNNRVVRSMQPSLDRFRQVYGVCQHQTVGAAIAFGRLLGLDVVGLENALGLAATLANVPSLRKYNWERRPLISLKDFNAPAAEAGVRAVQLDRCGLFGSKEVLDGDAGLWRMLGSDRFDPDLLVARLGSEWSLLTNSFKPYPACRWMHTALEAFATLVAEHALTPDDIEKVTIHTSAAMARDFMDYEPATMVDAQFSLPFAIAAIAYDIRPAAHWYESETLARTDLRSFGRCIVAIVDPAIDETMSGVARRPAGRVSIRAQGRRFSSALIAYPRGSAERPMSAAEVSAKFLENTGPVLGMDDARKLMDRLKNLEAEPGVSAVLESAARIPNRSG